MSDSLREALRTSTLKIRFTKKDGSLRNMVCTLNPDLIGSENLPKIQTEQKEEPKDYMRVFDLEAKGWRSFKINSLISSETVTN